MMASRVVLALMLYLYYFITLSPIDGGVQVKVPPTGDAFNELLLGTADLIRMKGYQAEEHYVITADGYILQLIRCTNPRLNNGNGATTSKKVILFIHGLISNANIFVVNSNGATPRDYSDKRPSKMSQAELQNLLADDPGRNSPPLQAMNMGHEVWFLNRRGALGSKKRTSGANSTVEQDTSFSLGPSIIENPLGFLSNLDDYLAEALSETVNSGYFKYSFDEQAKYDVRKTVDYICAKTHRQKIIVVGHSAGGAIILMALAHDPDLADRISRAVVYSPSLDLGVTFQEKLKYDFINFPSSYVGAIPPTKLVLPIRLSAASLCSIQFFQRTLCRGFLALLLGPNSNKQEILPGFFAGIFSSGSVREHQQLLESARNRQMHYYDFQNEEKNMHWYGQKVAPPYNMSQIRLPNITLWACENDGLVAPADIEKTVSKFTVPYDYRLSKGLRNHVSYFFDKDAYELYNIPSLQLFDME